jgi:hypothetical protein
MNRGSRRQQPPDATITQRQREAGGEVEFMISYDGPGGS